MLQSSFTSPVILGSLVPGPFDTKKEMHSSAPNFDHIFFRSASDVKSSLASFLAGWLSIKKLEIFCSLIFVLLSKDALRRIEESCLELEITSL